MAGRGRSFRLSSNAHNLPPNPCPGIATGVVHGAQPFQEADMSDTVEGGLQDSLAGAARRVAGGVQTAAGQVQHAVCKTEGGVTEVREVIRAQPIASALVVFALGYIFGRLG